MSRDEASELAQSLFAAYPATELRERTEETYIRFMMELDRETTRSSIDDLIRGNATLPSIAAVRGAVVERTLDLPRSSEAYESVCARGKEVHPLARYVAHLFGGEYNVRTSDSPGVMRAQFMRLYDEIRGEVVRYGRLPKRVREFGQTTAVRQARGPDKEDAWVEQAGRLFDDLPDGDRKRLLEQATESARRSFCLRSGELEDAVFPAPLLRGEAVRLLAAERRLIPGCSIPA